MPMDTWPTFWTKFAEMMRANHFFTSTKVKEEIKRGKDNLMEWMNSHSDKSFFIRVDDDILKCYQKAQDWVAGNPIYTEAARNEFATVADAYIIATAAARDMTLMTFEKSDPLCKRRVLIPDVCMALDVRCCDLNTALRELDIQI